LLALVLIGTLAAHTVFAKEAASGAHGDGKGSAAHGDGKGSAAPAGREAITRREATAWRAALKAMPSLRVATTTKVEKAARLTAVKRPRMWAHR
jgi:hypothetical protein